MEHNQKGWVKALPRVCFYLMNTVNSSTGFSPFQLKSSHSPCIFPPLVPSTGVPSAQELLAHQLIAMLELVVEYVIKCARKMQLEHISSMEVAYATIFFEENRLFGLACPLN